MNVPVLCAVMIWFNPGSLVRSSSAHNVLYMPAGTHMISLKSLDPESGQQVLLEYTITDSALRHYNTTIEQLEAGQVLQEPDGQRVLHLPSGRVIEIHVQERVLVRLLDVDGDPGIEVDMAGFDGRSLKDINNDSVLVPVPQPPLSWPSPHWRPVRSITVALNSTSLSVTLNRNNKVVDLMTKLRHASLIWDSAHGISLTVIHPRTSQVTFAYLFPTSEFGGYRDLVEVIRGVKAGRIVVLAGLHDGSMQLLQARKVLQQEAGSFVSEDYMFRDSWAWVFIKGGQSLGEAFSPNLLVDARKKHHLDYKTNNPESVGTRNGGLQDEALRLERHLAGLSLHPIQNAKAKSKGPSLSGKTEIDDDDLDRLFSLGLTSFRLPAVSRTDTNTGAVRKKTGNDFPQDKVDTENGSVKENKIISRLSGIKRYRHGHYSIASEDILKKMDRERSEAYIYTRNSYVLAEVENKTASPLLLDARIPVHEDPVYLLLEYDDCVGKWQQAHERRGGDSRWLARMRFCQTHDGYGSLCDCEDPFEMPVKDNTTQGVYQKDIPILVMTGNRTRLLFRLLDGLFRQPGVHLDQLTVVMDGWHEGAAQLAYILGFRLLQHQPEGANATRVSRNLRFALFNALDLYPKADAFIVLEDDLVVSPDFYKYMQHTSALFHLDPTVYCVSAFNHLSYPHTSYDPSQLYRVESFPAYGWMVPREGVIDLLPRWFPANVTHDWDFMMGMGLLTKQRECIIPDVNRALHGGIVGLHAKASWFMERHYSRRVINQDPDVELMDVKRLIKDTYDAEMDTLIANATIVNLVDSGDVDLPPSDSGFYVIYAHQPLPTNITNHTAHTVTVEDGANHVFKLLGEALQIWNTDTRELHDSTWRLHHRNQTLFVVGTPKSKFSRHIPKGESPVTTDGSDIEYFIKEEFTFAHLRKIPVLLHTEDAKDIWNKLFVGAKDEWNGGEPSEGAGLSSGDGGAGNGILKGNEDERSGGIRG